MGKVAVYTRFFEFANYRHPMSLFLCDVLSYYSLHKSKLHCLCAAKVSSFVINCMLLAIEPTVHVFRSFYHSTWVNGWVSFAKRARKWQCYTESIDALQDWRENFFQVDKAFFPFNYEFHVRHSLLKDDRPDARMYSLEDAQTLNANRIPINSFPEELLCLVGLSSNFFLRLEQMPIFYDRHCQGA